MKGDIWPRLLGATQTLARAGARVARIELAEHDLYLFDFDALTSPYVKVVNGARRYCGHLVVAGPDSIVVGVHGRRVPV